MDWKFWIDESRCPAIVKRRSEMPVAHFTSHDLRRTVATGIVDLGQSFEIAAIVPGHEAGGTGGQNLDTLYMRSALIDQKRAALEAWNINRLLAEVPSVPAGQRSGAESQLTCGNEAFSTSRPGFSICI